MTKKPEQSESEGRSKFYPQFQEPYWSKSQELIKVLGEVAEANDTSIASVSIAWALAQNGITCSLMGSSNAKHSIRNAQAADLELSAAELMKIDEAYQRIFG